MLYAFGKNHPLQGVAMNQKTFAQLRQSAQDLGIPTAAKLRKADLQQRLNLKSVPNRGALSKFHPLKYLRDLIEN